MKLWSLLVLNLLLAGCAGLNPSARTSPSATVIAPSAELSPTQVQQATNTITPQPSSTFTPTPTPTLTSSPSPLPSSTPTFTTTPTSEFPLARALMQAFCRYGPAKAYLYSHGLYEGDLAEVHGRNFNSHWLWIKPNNLDRHCWAAASVVEVTGDVSGLPVVQTRLPKSTLYGPPDDVQANRDGDQVVVTWNRVWMTLDDDRGYLIEANICQNGHMVWVAVQTNDNSYEFTDERTCTAASTGKLYTVEKHGYTDPVEIPWP